MALDKASSWSPWRHIPGALHWMAIRFVFDTDLIKAAEKVVKWYQCVMLLPRLLESRYMIQSAAFRRKCVVVLGIMRYFRSSLPPPAVIQILLFGEVMLVTLNPEWLLLADYHIRMTPVQVVSLIHSS
jgi:hypothetical protein